MPRYKTCPTCSTTLVYDDHALKWVHLQGSKQDLDCDGLLKCY